MSEKNLYEISYEFPEEEQSVWYDGKTYRGDTWQDAIKAWVYWKARSEYWGAPPVQAQSDGSRYPVISETPSEDGQSGSMLLQITPLLVDHVQAIITIPPRRYVWASR